MLREHLSEPSVALKASSSEKQEKYAAEEKDKAANANGRIGHLALAECHAAQIESKTGIRDDAGPASGAIHMLACSNSLSCARSSA